MLDIEDFDDLDGITIPGNPYEEEADPLGPLISVISSIYTYKGVSCCPNTPNIPVLIYVREEMNPEPFPQVIQYFEDYGFQKLIETECDYPVDYAFEFGYEGGLDLAFYRHDEWDVEGWDQDDWWGWEFFEEYERLRYREQIKQLRGLNPIYLRNVLSVEECRNLKPSSIESEASMFPVIELYHRINEIFGLAPGEQSKTMLYLGHVFIYPVIVITSF